MTEEEWLAVRYDPSDFILFLARDQEASDRKLRLFAVACCRRVWEYLPGAGSRQAVEVAERYADGVATREELDAAHEAAEPSESADYGEVGVAAHAAERPVDADSCALNASLLAADTLVPRSQGTPEEYKRWEEADNDESHAQTLLLREIFGNPFRPVEFDPAWRTSDVMLLARGIYEEKAFDRMPILADALQDAGCDRDDILNHLRDPQATHVRGCWALDLVLGKE
jgi:hypothetical protein